MIGTTNYCRRILSVCFLIFVVQNLSYCFDLLRLLRLVASSCCILNLISVLSWFHTLDLYSSATGTTSLAGRTVSFRGRIFAVGGECGWSLVVSWSWNVIFACILLNSPFYCWYDWLCRSYLYYIVFSIEVWGALMYSKLVMISTISCVGRTVIYLSIIYF